MPLRPITKRELLAQSVIGFLDGIIMKRIIHYYLSGIMAALSVGVQADQDFLGMSLSELNLPEFNEYSVPVVLTATRLQQHQADVPASVTILDEHFIKQIGAQNIAELLRYVPGMMVGPDNNNNSDTVHYHGGPAAFPKNLQVLINGRSMYRSGLAAVSWYEMPVAIEDIKRIEVVRGPNSASYGSNAFQAVINILTKHPADTYGSSVSLQSGNNGEENIYLKQGGHIGASDYRVSFTQKKSDQYEVDSDSRLSRFVDFEHYHQSGRFGEFETSAVILDAKKGQGDGFAFQINKNETSEQRIEVGSRWTKDFSNKHQVQVSAYSTQYRQRQKADVAGVYVALLDQDLKKLYSLNPAAANAFVAQQDPTSLSGSAEEDALILAILTRYQPIGAIDALAPVSGEIHSDLDEYRYDVEVQNTYIFSSDLTLVSGASFRRDEVMSDTYFDGYLNNDTTRLFASATWQATVNTNLHLGLMAEQESDADLVFAPRAAMNYKLTPSQSLRFVYSESVRSPDLFEQDANWQLTLKNTQSSVPLNGTTYFQTQQGPSNLDHQYIRSYEVGYYGRFNRFNSELDIRVFEEDLTDVYYQSLTLAEIETIDDISMRFQGVEWQYSIEAMAGTQIRWIGAYVDAKTNISNDAEGNSRERVLLRVYARNTHTLSWLQTWSDATSSSVSYILANEYDDLTVASGRTLLERIDLKVIHNIALPKTNLELSANIQHDLSSDPYIWLGNIYEDETRFQLAARFNF
ncbi:MAG: iron complex outermembrane receptor protein [Oceanicoccus sp.]